MWYSSQEENLFRRYMAERFDQQKHRKSRPTYSPFEPQGRYGTNPLDWVQTKEQKKPLQFPLKCKPGVPLYTFDDVDFSVSGPYGTQTPESDRRMKLKLEVKKIDLVAEFYVSENVSKFTCKKVWEILINAGKFPYPYEILN